MGLWSLCASQGFHHFSGCECELIKNVCFSTFLIADVESFIYRNLDFMEEKNMVTIKINKDNGEKYFLLNLEGLLFVAFGWDLSTSDERNELRYMLVKEFIEKNSKK